MPLELTELKIGSEEWERLAKQEEEFNKAQKVCRRFREIRMAKERMFGSNSNQEK